jgi:hypothetical protein
MPIVEAQNDPNCYNAQSTYSFRLVNLGNCIHFWAGDRLDPLLDRRRFGFGATPGNWKFATFLTGDFMTRAYSLAVMASALVLSFTAVSATAADNITGYGWVTTPGVASDATPASLAGACKGGLPCTPANADVTFTTTGISFPSQNTTTITNWLASSAFPLNNLVNSTAAGTGLENTIWEFVGKINVVTGQPFSITHDDGVTLIVNGQNFGFFATSTPARAETGNYTGKPDCSASFTLVYGESPGVVAQLTTNIGPANAPKPCVVTLDGPFQVRYASNLTIGDSVVNITNTGANGNNLYGPGFGTPEGNLCVNVYAFSPDEQLISCCSCLVTPNGLVHVTANNDLVSNTLTGIRPNSIVIKLVATATGADMGGHPTYSGSSCTNSAAQIGTTPFQIVESGLLAWGTTLHSSTNVDPPPANAVFSITETPFLPATLDPSRQAGVPPAPTGSTEIASLANRCTNIIGNGSSFGICRSCRLGGLGGAKQ